MPVAYESLRDMSQGQRYVFTIGGARYVTRCWRQCIEADSGDQFARSAEICFSPSFLSYLDGLRNRETHCESVK